MSTGEPGTGRRLAAAAALVVLGSLTACGGGGNDAADAPDDASQDEFCAAFNGLFDRVMGEAPSGDQAAMVRALKEWADDIEEIGTPAEMPEDARRGFELFVEQAEEIDENADLQDLQNLGEDLSEEDQADGRAFTDWTQDNCPLDLPSSDLPTTPAS